MGRRILIVFAVLALAGCSSKEDQVHSEPINRLKEILKVLLVEKDLSALPLYYHPDFRFYSNGLEMNYGEYLLSHQKISGPDVHYAIDYDRESAVENKDKAAIRLWVTKTQANQPASKMEVILIVEFKDGKIYRLWELTYPNWLPSR